MTENNTDDRVVSSSINQGVPADVAVMTYESAAEEVDDEPATVVHGAGGGEAGRRGERVRRA